MKKPRMPRHVDSTNENSGYLRWTIELAVKLIGSFLGSLFGHLWRK